ncbi:MAG TPA: hypothetical protein VFS43_09675 [Polyangiaceae bacterium]|nr:hypothetical protein [Polyangiaceae bacterium]
MFGLDYTQAPCVKAYRGGGVDWHALSWQAQAIFRALWIEAGPSGSVAVGELGAEAAVAGLTGVPLPVVKKHFPALVASRAVTVAGGLVTIRDFDAAQDAAQSPAARKRAQRERDAAKSRFVTECPTPVTTRDVPPGVASRVVTKGHVGVTNRDGTDVALKEKREENFTHTQGAGTHAHASAHEGGTSDPLAAELLTELQSHPPLADVATPRLAAQLAGAAATSGKKPEWLKAAIADAARDAGTQAAVGHPLHTPELAKLVGRYCARASPERPPNGRPPGRADPPPAQALPRPFAPPPDAARARYEARAQTRKPAAE